CRRACGVLSSTRGKAMATKKTQAGKAKAQAAKVERGSYWLAGVGAISLGRKRAEALLGDLVTEGRRLQGEASETVREARANAEARVTGLVGALKTRARAQAKKAAAAFDAGVAGLISRLGIPTKADIDDLAQRVNALSRQIKAAK